MVRALICEKVACAFIGSNPMMVYFFSNLVCTLIYLVIKSTFSPAYTVPAIDNYHYRFVFEKNRVTILLTTQAIPYMSNLAKNRK